MPSIPFPQVAAHLGIDYVRVDWFLGGPSGLQLNEVTYGGLDASLGRADACGSVRSRPDGTARSGPMGRL